jgi:hypothetical protein
MLAHSTCLHPHKHLSLLVVAREGGCVVRITNKVVFFGIKYNITRHSCYACTFHMFASPYCKYLSLLVVAREGGCVVREQLTKSSFYICREFSITWHSCYACKFHMFASS